MNHDTEEKLRNELIKRKRTAVYFYSPFCGTCKLAGRMLDIVEEMLEQLPLIRCNLNELPGLARKWEIESIPCLVFCEDGEPVGKQYRMGSVDELYSLLLPYHREYSQ